jgi:hypothetical protein
MMPRIKPEIEARIRIAAKDRCGYCLSPQRLVMAPLEIEHLTPIARGGTDDEDNLWLSCPICNRHKANKIDGVDPQTTIRERLFNPRIDVWNEHFRWSSDGLRVIGKTPIGRATVNTLQLDRNPRAILVRKAWVLVGWHPPSDALQDQADVSAPVYPPPDPSPDA